MTNEINNQPKQKYADVSNAYVQNKMKELKEILDKCKNPMSLAAYRTKRRRVRRLRLMLSFALSNA